MPVRTVAPRPLQVARRTGARCSSGSRCPGRRSRCPPGCPGSSSGTSRSARPPTARAGRAKNDRANASNSIAWARSDIRSAAEELGGRHRRRTGRWCAPGRRPAARRPARRSEPSRSRRPRLGERANRAIRFSGGAAGSPVRSSGGQLPGDHRVAADRAQEAQLGIDPPQHRTPGVVVPEEGVEAVLDHLLGAVRQGVRPGAEPAAEGGRRLQQGDRHPALGQHHRGADPGHPGPDHHRLGARWDVAGQLRAGSATSTRGRIRSGAARARSRPLPTLSECRQFRPSTSGGRAAMSGIARPGGLAGGMTVELGRYGVWRTAAGLGPELAAEIERLGFGAIWIGGSPAGGPGAGRVDAGRDRADRGGHRRRQHVGDAGRGGRRVLPPHRGSLPGPVPARRGHRASGGARASTAARSPRSSTTWTASTRPRCR